MSSKGGFTLIEAVVAALVGLIGTLAIGGLGERIIHHRVTADSNSAVLSLAERQLETLLADANPNPTSTQCSATPPPDLCGAAPPSGLAHGPNSVDGNGNAAGSGLYQVQWTVVDGSSASTSPLVLPASASFKVKKITVTVTHLNNPLVNATLSTFYKVS
jgi:type II secretory pathway pseudopilin PulG